MMKYSHSSLTPARLAVTLLVALTLLLLSGFARAQGITGTLIVSVRSADGSSMSGARAVVSSRVLIGGPASAIADQEGSVRFLALPPGDYELTIEMAGFSSFREPRVVIGAGTTLERTVVLSVADVAESVVVQGRGSRIDVRNTGFATRFGPDDLRLIPTRRSSMFDLLRAAPGLSPTSPTSGTVTTVSAFGSATNENQFLFDGMNFTCPCNGVARAEPGIDFIQEIHVQSVGASVEFGNVQGAVVNAVTRQGGDRYAADVSYFAQTAALTSQPIVLPIPTRAGTRSGYERVRYRDGTGSLGGPAVRDRLWFFAGYQYLRDYDAQPGADPTFPRTYEQNKAFGKLTWRLNRAWQLVQSVHTERWINPDPPTLATPFEATLRRTAWVPAMTFGDLTHTWSGNTTLEVRVGRFLFAQKNTPATGTVMTANRTDSVTGVSSGSASQFGTLNIARTTGKATLGHYSPRRFGVSHDSKVGLQIEQGEHHSETIVPTGVRYIDRNGQPSQAVFSAPAHVGAAFTSTAAFASDAVNLGERLTITAGLRFDHTRAFSQDLRAVDLAGQETQETISGLGTLYTWNLLSPRVGTTVKLTKDGRTIARASFGRFYQGVLTGEHESFHPGATSTITRDFNAETGGYTDIRSVVDPRVNLQLDPGTRAPRTDEYSVGIDRELGTQLVASAAFVHKEGRDFIGWTEIAGQYRDEERVLPDGRLLQVRALDTAATPTAARRFLLTNPSGYFVRYDGLVMSAEKRQAHGWQAFGSYTLSRSSGLQAGSGAAAAGPQVSTVSPPQPLTFGRDPNDLTNARGRLANDRPHMIRAMGSLEVPHSGVVLAANMQHFTGKPWAASAVVALPQNAQQRVLIEPRGSRRLSSQTLLDVRVSTRVPLGGLGRAELLVDVLNALNETAEESLTTDNLFSPTFAQGSAFVDPRRAMVGLRLSLGH